jgi:hypothetical protein
MRGQQGSRVGPGLRVYVGLAGGEERGAPVMRREACSALAAVDGRRPAPFPTITRGLGPAPVSVRAVP